MRWNIGGWGEEVVSHSINSLCRWCWLGIAGGHSMQENGKWRVCVDFRPLNVATKWHHYPMASQDYTLDEVVGHERYSICEGFCGYFQIEINLIEVNKNDEVWQSHIRWRVIWCFRRKHKSLDNYLILLISICSSCIYLPFALPYSYICIPFQFLGHNI